MTITKEKIEITTVNTVVALVLGIGAIFAIFYNSKAQAQNDISTVSERVSRIETIAPVNEKRFDSIDKRFDKTDKSMETIQGLLQTYLSQSSKK